MFWFANVHTTGPENGPALSYRMLPQEDRIGGPLGPKFNAPFSAVIV